MIIWSREIQEIERLYESFKGQVPDLEKELDQLIKTQDPNVAMLYSRRCLEIIITDLCECELKRPRKTEPLKGIIDKLNREEKVPSHIITSMDHVNGLATFGTHPKDFDPEQIKPVLNNLTTIIKWYLKYKESQSIDKIKAGPEKAEPMEKFEEIGKEDRREKQTKPFKSSRQKLMLGIFITAIILAVIVLYAFPKIFKRDTVERLRSSDGTISVAVMPFKNMTNETTWNIWQDGIRDLLITSLSNSEELKVRQSESINTVIRSQGFTDYASFTPSAARTISQKLEAKVFVYGNIMRAGDTISLNAQLINSKTEEIIKSFQIVGPAREDMIFSMMKSLSGQVKNFLIITNLIDVVSNSRIFTAPDLPTTSPDAYKNYIQGCNYFFNNLDYRTARNFLHQAIDIDSNFVDAIVLLAIAYGNEGFIDQGKKWCLKAYEKRDQTTMLEKIYINWLYAGTFETPHEQIIYIKQHLDYDGRDPGFLYLLGGAYFQMHQENKAIPLFEESLEKYSKWGTKPAWVYSYFFPVLIYHKTGQFKKEKKLLKKAVNDFPDDYNLLQCEAILALSERDTILANKYIEKYISNRRENSWSEAAIMSDLAGAFFMYGNLKEAEEYYRKALSFEPENPVRMNDLAKVLVENKQKVKESMELIDKALKSSPDNWAVLDTKGWGLYKQGKYQEALKLILKADSLKPVYSQDIYDHLVEVKKTIAGQK
jgi:Tfp pilus assembly protein PilF/TolB-like protein